MTDLTKLRQIAEAAKAEAPGEWTHGPSGIVQIRGGNGIIFWDDDGRKAVYPHIATFDPPTVLALLDAIRELQRWMEYVANHGESGGMDAGHSTDCAEADAFRDCVRGARVALSRADEILKGAQ